MLSKREPSQNLISKHAIEFVMLFTINYSLSFHSSGTNMTWEFQRTQAKFMLVLTSARARPNCLRLVPPDKLFILCSPVLSWLDHFSAGLSFVFSALSRDWRVDHFICSREPHSSMNVIQTNKWRNEEENSVQRLNPLALSCHHEEGRPRGIKALDQYCWLTHLQ